MDSNIEKDIVGVAKRIDDLARRTSYQYIYFVKVADKPKTSVWSCRKIRSDTELGQVRWYSAWRQYCFFSSCPAVFNMGCLDDIKDFIMQLCPNRTRA